MLRQNLEYSKGIHKMMVRTQRYILWSQIFSIIKLVIIIVPVVLAILYAVPILREAIETYKQLMGNIGGGSSVPGDFLKGFLGQ